ncbi:alpha/beta hydrolase [Streptomyces sp. M19]
MESQRAMCGDFWDGWLGSSCPALLLRGEHSPLLPAGHAREMAARRPRTELREFPGCGHWIHDDAPGSTRGPWAASCALCHDHAMDPHRPGVLAASLLVSAVLLTGCGSSPSPPSSASSPVARPVPSGSYVVKPDRLSASDLPAYGARPTASSAASPTGSPTASPDGCHGSGIDLRVTGSDAAAGLRVMSVELVNRCRGSTPCGAIPRSTSSATAAFRWRSGSATGRCPSPGSTASTTLPRR